MQHGSEVSARAPACCRYSMGSVGLTMQYSDVCVAGHPANCSQKAGGVVPSYVSFLDHQFAKPVALRAGACNALLLVHSYQ